ncbi:hypothetical protein LPJ68_002888 [Coemansia sp. RSA 1086]|nr:hypothetical protein LPJ68_002888 [Coemansia sp. RSA 1086]
MSKNNKLSAEAIGAKASVQEEQAHHFSSLNGDKKKKDYSHLIGKKYVAPEEHEQMKAQRKGAVDEAREFTTDHLPKVCRVLRDNGIMPLDYCPDCLSVFLDNGNKCTSIVWI